MSEPWQGEDRRKESMSVQRDLGRIDNELTNLARRIGDHIEETAQYHERSDARFTARSAEVDAQFKGVLEAIQGQQIENAEKRGGWKATARIASALLGSGAVVGGVVIGIIEWLGGGGQ